jgi:hypothetical protein
MAFENVSTSDLETLQTNTLASLNRSLNAEGYGIGSRNLQRASIGALSKLLAEISEELAHRTDQTGGIGVVEIGDEPS